MDLSKYLAGKIANWINGSTFPSAPVSLRVALSNGDPLYDASGLVEPTHGYARQTITFSPAVSDDEKSAIGQTNHVIFTPTSGQAFGALTHVAIFDVSGNMLFSGALAVPKTYGVDETVDFLAGTLKCNFTFFFTSYLGEAILNWINGTAMAAPPASLKMALLLRDPGFRCDAVAHVQPGHGAFSTDVLDVQDAYALQKLTFAAMTQALATGTTLSNSAPILFGPAQDAWGVITHWAVFTDTGAMIINGSFAVPKNIQKFSGFGFETGSLVVIIK